jgi:hypothetical protein
MKKLIYLFSAIALIFTSCSSEDSSTSSTPVLLTKAIETYLDNSTSTTEYVYSGTKLVSVNDSDGDYQIFTYTGNLITKIEYFLSDDTLDQVETYSYDSSDRLISFVRVFPTDINWGNKETYTYNSNGTISASYYSGNYTSQTNLDDTAIITLSNGEVSQIEFSNGRSDSYTFDSKNGASKNIMGFDKLLFTDGEGGGILHNIISQIDSDDINNFTYSYTYNNNDYPATGTETSEYDNEVTTIEYFYNQ